MGQGHCVIGLEQTAQGAFHSVRPMPRRGYAWPAFFPYGRGSIIRFSPAATPLSPPHLEDQNTHGLAPSGEEVGEGKLVEMLARAELSANLQGLFGCQLHIDTQGGNAWADPNSATRSICGCNVGNIRFRVYSEGGEVSLRAKLLLPSGEVLNSLPLVDREWRRFFNDFVRHSSQTSSTSDLEFLLNQSIRNQLRQAPSRFARIGLARGRPDEAKCWLMLDSLFPQPNAAWLSQ